VSISDISIMEKAIVAAVEGGGTTFEVAIADISSGNYDIINRCTVVTSHENPSSTISECANFLEKHKPDGGYHSLGIACFGPLGVNEKDTTSYGSILMTSPKVSWRGVNLLQPLQLACQGSKRQLRVAVDTDVNAPAMAEFLMRKNEEITSLAYITVGTGVGVGMIIHGKPVHGRMHPEAGHVPVQPLEGDDFEGYSWGKDKNPFQGRHTVEALASSVALTERLQKIQGSNDLDRDILADLPNDHEIWDHAANAIANLCVTLLLVVSIEKIVLGGGVMKRSGLIEKIRRFTRNLLNGYIDLPDDLSTLICHPYYESDAGIIGAITLAHKVMEN
jgi:fructokinase